MDKKRRIGNWKLIAGLRHAGEIVARYAHVLANVVVCGAHDFLALLQCRDDRREGRVSGFVGSDVGEELWCRHWHYVIKVLNDELRFFVSDGLHLFGRVENGGAGGFNCTSFLQNAFVYRFC